MRKIVVVHFRDDVRLEIAERVTAGLRRLGLVDVIVGHYAQVDDAITALSEEVSLEILFAILHSSNSCSEKFYTYCEDRRLPVVVVTGGSKIDRPWYMTDSNLFVPRIRQRCENIPVWMEFWYSRGGFSFAPDVLRHTLDVFQGGDRLKTIEEADELLGRLALFDLTLQAVLRKVKRGSSSVEALINGNSEAEAFREMLVQCAATAYPFGPSADALIRGVLKLGRQRVSEPSLPWLGSAASGPFRRLWDLIRAAYADAPACEESYDRLPPEWHWKRGSQPWYLSSEIRGDVHLFATRVEEAHEDYVKNCEKTAKKVREYCRGR